MLKRLVARLPVPWQREFKRLHFRRQINKGAFQATDPEFEMLAQFVGPGDWAIDIGANVGHYTKRLSDIVGPHGRVIAVEPVPETFALLAANTMLFQHRNVTLLNLAASDRTAVVGMRVPMLPTGLKNYYRASITPAGAELHSFSMPLDQLGLENRVALIKIDAEGHDGLVLDGLARLVERDHPTLIVEADTPAVAKILAGHGYRAEKLPGSVNSLFHWEASSAGPEGLVGGEESIRLPRTPFGRKPVNSS